MTLASSASMRSLSCITSLMGFRVLWTLSQAVAERDPFVEHEALAAPAALCFRNFFQIFQDAALEVIDLGEAASEQMCTGFFAADAAGAKHGDPAVLGGIEAVGGKFLELAEARDPGIERALERA